MTEYRRYQGKSYMVCICGAALEGYEYPMLAKNRIFGLLPFQMIRADGTVQFWYDISGRQALEEWAKIKKPGSEFLKNFFSALSAVLERAGEYLLPEDGVSLDPEQIFVDADGQGIAFCYTPFEKTAFPEALRGFMEYFLSHMEHDGGEGTKQCYAVYEKCQQGHSDLEKLLGMLMQEVGTKENYRSKELDQPIKQERVPQKILQQWDKQPKRTGKKYRKGMKSICAQKSRLFTKRNVAKEAFAFEPEECPKESSNPTLLLGSEIKEILGEFKYEGDGEGENLSVTTSVFLIGSRREEVDGVILKDTVSRIHARVTKEEGSFYLEDLNSTNGTYHNGELLNYRDKIKLEKNDRVTFAQEEYRFV